MICWPLGHHGHFWVFTGVLKVKNIYTIFFFLLGQPLHTHTLENCTQHALSMNTHNSVIHICIILQLFTNLPEVTTLYEVCSNIFNRAKPSNNQIRCLHRHICLHLGIEESSETTITDLPHLLLGHYSSDTMITLPFTCAFSLSIREEPGSLVHFPVPPPDVKIDHQVQNKLSSKRRKTNSSVQSPKKIKITIAWT